MSFTSTNQELHLIETEINSFSYQYYAAILSLEYNDIEQALFHFYNCILDCNEIIKILEPSHPWGNHDYGDNLRSRLIEMKKKIIV
jgi:hypothetical protein